MRKEVSYDKVMKIWPIRVHLLPCSKNLLRRPTWETNTERFGLEFRLQTLSIREEQPVASVRQPLHSVPAIHIDRRRTSSA